MKFVSKPAARGASVINITHITIAQLNVGRKTKIIYANSSDKFTAPQLLMPLLYFLHLLRSTATRFAQVYVRKKNLFLK